MQSCFNLVIFISKDALRKKNDARFGDSKGRVVQEPQSSNESLARKTNSTREPLSGFDSSSRSNPRRNLKRDAARESNGPREQLVLYY